PGDEEAYREALDVPLPRPRQRLVEVVLVEHELARRRRVRTEVREVGIAAELDGQSTRGPRGQIAGHDPRRPPVEGERRDAHPAVADRNEARHAGLVLPHEQLDRVAPIGGRLPARTARPRHRPTGLTAELA